MSHRGPDIDTPVTFLHWRPRQVSSPFTRHDNLGESARFATLWRPTKGGKLQQQHVPVLCDSCCCLCTLLPLLFRQRVAHRPRRMHGGGNTLPRCARHRVSLSQSCRIASQMRRQESRSTGSQVSSGLIMIIAELKRGSLFADGSCSSSHRPAFLITPLSCTGWMVTS